MRTLVLATTFPRYEADTIPAFVRDLADEMVRRGHDVTVLAPHAPGARLRETWRDLDVHRFRYFAPTSLQRLAYGGGIINNVRRSHLAKLQVPTLSFQIVRHAMRLAKATRSEVIHSHWILPCGIAGARTAAKLAIPHVVTLHAGDVAGLRKLPQRAAIARYVIRRSNKVIAVSRSVAHSLSEILPPETRDALDARLEILPMGVHTHALQTGAAATLDDKTFLFIGRLVEKKGVHVLLDAFAEVSAAEPTARLILCGDGPLRQEIEKRAAMAGIAGRVDIRGAVSEAEKRALLRARPILVAPSIAARNGDVEGLPVTVLEGLAAGCAVVASRTGGISDALSDATNGVLVPSGEAGSLAKAMLRVLHDGDLRARIMSHAAASATAFDWGAIGERYEQILVESSAGRLRPKTAAPAGG